MRYSRIVAIVVSVKAPRILSHISAFTACSLLVTALVAPRQAVAIENYYGNVVGQCVTYENITYNVKASISTQSPNWFVTSLQYVFNTTPPSIPFTPSTWVDPPDGKTRYFLVTPGTYTVTVQNPSGLQGEYQVTVPSCGPVSNCVSPPNTTMVAWYPFDEPAGPTAANLSTGNTGAHIGSPTPITGMVGGALNFDGIDDYVESPSTIVTNIGPAGLPSTCSGLGSTCRGDFSIDAWIRVDSSAPNSAITIFDKRGSSASSINGYAAYVYQQNRIGVQLADGGTGGGFTNYNSIVLNPPLIDGQWHHIAITVKRRGPGKIRFYHNGLLVGPPQSTTRWGSLVNNSPLRIGTRTAATPLTGWFQGDIDELEIFNRVLTQNEVKSIFNAGPSGKCKP